MEKIGDAINLMPNVAGATRYDFHITGKRIIGFMFGAPLPLVNTCLFRVFANNHQVIPLAGDLVIGSGFESISDVLPVDILLEGPPYNAQVEVIGTPGETGFVEFIALSTNSLKDPLTEIVEGMGKIASILGG